MRAADDAHTDYLAWQAPQPVPGELDLWQIVQWLDRRLPDDAILANGAGNYSTWVHRLFRYRGFRTQLAPYVGSMGYGVPAAVAAKVVHPERIVVSWNGDGCFLMNGQELATAVQYGLAVVFVVVDNGMYGTIRMHQERTYPAREYGTALVNPVAGELVAGTAYTILLAPRSVVGSQAPQTAAFTAPAALVLVDQQPARTAP